MLKSQIIQALHHKHNNLSLDDIEQLFNIFVSKISNSLKYYNNSLSIPIHYNLKAKELKKIVDALRKLTDNN